MKMKPRRERPFDETVCLQRDSLDLYIDGEIVATQPISPDGMDILKGMANDRLHSGCLFQIKIRNRVQWESVPTKLDVDPETLFSYETNIL
jgi:hypothetical protein